MSRRLALSIAALLGLTALLAFQVMNSRAREAEELRLSPLASIPIPPPAQAAPPPPVQQPPAKKANTDDEPDVDIGIPIPQDPERQRKRRRDHLAWSQRTLGGAYERVGKKDPRWDEPAREALAVAAHYFSHDAEVVTVPQQIFAPAKKAVDAGCDDPLILHLYAHSSVLSNWPTYQERMRRFIRAAEAIQDSAYPATRRALVLFDAATTIVEQGNLTDQDREKAGRMYDAALAMLPQSVAEGDRSPLSDHEWYIIPKYAFEGYRQIGMRTEDAFELVDATMAKVPALKVERLKLRGDFLIRHAWDARGSGFAGSVTEEGWQLFHDRLIEAGEVLEEAWKRQPGDPRTATSIITVNMGLGGTRETMEKWFERAMKADGDFVAACSAKLEWLEPKWHGSPEELFTFGKACRATKNRESGITLIYAEAFMRKILAEQRASGKETKFPFNVPSVRYRVLNVYKNYLELYPANTKVRSEMLGFTYEGVIFHEGMKQAEILGEDVLGTPYFSRKFLMQVQEFYKREAERQAKELEDRRKKHEQGKG